MRRTRIEHILSALPLLATEERTFGIAAPCQEADMALRVDAIHEEQDYAPSSVISMSFADSRRSAMSG
jgi:hypothetical protein